MESCASKSAQFKAENTTIESFQFHARFNGFFNLPLTPRYSRKACRLRRHRNLLLRRVSPLNSPPLLQGIVLRVRYPRTESFPME